MTEPVRSAARSYTYPIHELLAARWSPRSFADRPVDAGTLGALLEAARWAPSSATEQPCRLIVGPRDDAQTWSNVLACINERNQRWAKTAPVLMLACAMRHSARSGQPNAFAWYDTGQAVAHMTFQAAALGLYVHQMGGFSRDVARERFAIPPEADAVTAIAVGYLGEPAVLPEDLRVRELARSQRKPLTELAYGATWGTVPGFVTP